MKSNNNTSACTRALTLENAYVLLVIKRVERVLFNTKSEKDARFTRFVKRKEKAKWQHVLC